MTIARTAEPSYTRIIEELRTRVVTGTWVPGQKVSTEKELAQEFKVCSATIKKSLKELEREGLFWAVRGKGRFVSSQSDRQKTWALGVVLFNLNHLSHPVLSQRLAGIQEVISKTDYHFKLFAINAAANVRLENRSNNLWMGLVDPQTIDGVIVVAQQVEEEQVRALADHVPVVWTDHPTVRTNMVGVRLDYLGGAFAAAKHLVELGHRRIALIAVREQFNVGREQRDGVQLAMQDPALGGQGRVTLLAAEGNTVDEGRRLGASLVEFPDRPTAVICGSDDLALGAYEVFRQNGLKVPRDMSLVAWNDILTTQQIPVPLTTIRMNFRSSGTLAAERLLWLMEHPNQPCESDKIPSELVVRESTAPPQKSD